jgi:uncharacterized membrane protein
MPADVSFENVVPRREAASGSRRLPLGFGLAIAAVASISLWAGAAIGIRALLS